MRPFEGGSWGHFHFYNILHHGERALARISSSKTTVDTLKAILEPAIPILNRAKPSLLHNDAHPWNVLVEKNQDGWTCSAWLDWEYAWVGDPTWDLRESMEVIKTLTDQGPILLRCSERILKEAVSKRLEELDAFLVRVPLTLEQTRSAVRRVNDEIPPNGPKNQQFKDSVLWEAVLELAKSFRVVLVTYDKAFFEDRKPDRGLAAELKADCEREGQDVSLIHGEALVFLRDFF